MSNSFDGMAEVESHKAYTAALACICHTERQRTRIFNEEVDDVLNTIVKWWYKEYEWKLNRLFRSYPLCITKEEAQLWVRERPLWYEPEWKNI